MQKTAILTAFCILLLPLYALSAQHGAVVDTRQVEKPAKVGPVKAKPVQKPKATSTKDKLSVTGYGEDPGEETQERPNPLNRQGLERSEPIKSPVR